MLCYILRSLLCWGMFLLCLLVHFFFYKEGRLLSLTLRSKIRKGDDMVIIQQCHLNFPLRKLLWKWIILCLEDGLPFILIKWVIIIFSKKKSYCLNQEPFVWMTIGNPVCQIIVQSLSDFYIKKSYVKSCSVSLQKYGMHKTYSSTARPKINK